MASSRPTPILLHVFGARTGLIKAARELFLAGSHTSVTVDDICLAAGASKGGFYHHFPDKEGVFLAIALDELEREAASIADGREDIFRRGPRAADRPSAPVALSPSARRRKSPANPDSESASGGLRMTEPAEECSSTSPKRRGARYLQPISSQPQSPAGPDASALLVDLWALAPRRRPVLRQVRAAHRRALKQALQSQLGKPSENSERGDREAQATTAFLMWIGFLVHRALAREVAIDRRGREKAVG
jgi:AcrR family transcriptional regulator